VTEAIVRLPVPVIEEPARTAKLQTLAISLCPLRLLLIPLHPLFRAHEGARVRTLLLHGCRRAIATSTWAKWATPIVPIKRAFLPEEVQDAAKDEQPPGEPASHVMH
jgi:hypothetical protein